MAEFSPPDGDDGDEQEAGVTRRQRSKIAFPYTDFEGALAVAQAIHGNVGHGTCSAAGQLAPWMHLSAKSSSFRSQLAAARLFGLIDNENSENYRLTPLGTRVVDPTQARGAKVEAFLNVPLFAALFERYKGGVTPQSGALEHEIVALGVSEKQKARARQVFESSANQTGFREQGPNRLVMPAVIVPSPTPTGGEGGNGGPGNTDVAPGGGGASGVILDLDPLLIALLQKIPRTGDGWPKDRRLRWFRTFAMNVSQVYDDEGEPVELRVSTDEIAPQAGGSS